MDRALRVVFFGTPQFAVPSLRALLTSSHIVAGVFTQPDKPRGRGQRVTESPVKQLAREHGIPVLQPDRLKDEATLAALRALAPDLGVVAAYGRILPAAVLATPPLGLVNVHASLLPRHRGAAPVHRAVMAGDLETGISIMRVVQALDAGPVYRTATRLIGPDDTSAEVEEDLARIGAELLLEVIADIVSGLAAPAPQDDHASTYAPRLQKEEGAIDWSASSSVIHNQVRGLHPWPLAWTWLAGHRLIILTTRLDSPAGAIERESLAGFNTAAPGTIVGISRDALSVRTGDGVLDVVLVRPEGRRAMSVGDFAAGHPLTVGTRFDDQPAVT
ncbi:MAG: methionyl-tRNA formyltransferase [Acidobacteria bacterium]|nr:methionyl-tRNA formyltransferase [Acidobacteriota bacterium]